MRFVSILGDSISTYLGYNPEGYRVFYDENNIYLNNITSPYDTWWAKVNQYLHAYLCVNNSYSGSQVTGDAFPSASCDERTSFLNTKEHNPDMILVYIGYNDFGRGISITNDESRGVAFFDSYCNMLKKLKTNYPNSRIICATLMKGYMRDNKDWQFPYKFAGISIDEYNAAIKIAAQIEKVDVADLVSQNIYYETLDGSHPTKEGHLSIAKAWILSLRDLKII